MSRRETCSHTGYEWSSRAGLFVPGSWAKRWYSPVFHRVQVKERSSTSADGRRGKVSFLVSFCSSRFLDFCSLCLWRYFFLFFPLFPFNPLDFVGPSQRPRYKGHSFSAGVAPGKASSLPGDRSCEVAASLDSTACPHVFICSLSCACISVPFFLPSARERQRKTARLAGFRGEIKHCKRKCTWNARKRMFCVDLSHACK